MPLPFLKPKQMASHIMTMRTPDETSEPAQDDSGLRSAAADLIAAIGAGDEQGVASALRSAFAVLESEPHDEAEPDETGTE